MMPRSKEGKERQDPSFTTVVRTHEKEQIFDGDHESECPEDEGEYSEHVSWRGRQRMAAMKALPERIEGARADIAVNYPERSQAEQEDLATPFFLSWCVSC